MQVNDTASGAVKKHHECDAGIKNASIAVKSYYLANSFAFN